MRSFVVAIWLFISVIQMASADELQFARDIQLIFAERCLNCHGADKAEGGLRLTSLDVATKELDSGLRAIVPGDTSSSELLRRVMSTDIDERMPPEGEPLSPAETRKLAAWIAQGADWEIHWAYRPIERPKVPRAGFPSGMVEIDRFVRARLKPHGISPSFEADRYTLIKRLYYDLLGVSPTTDAVDAFVNDSAFQAYERLVDRIIASPLFGERWGRHWLDKARYADTDGYEKDNARLDAWRYRDWVIHAMNSDLPFDQFTIEQLAGDLLPHATVSQRLATAFNRQTLTNTEGGTDQEQWRVAAVMDRTETLGTVWLGLTVGCARCHTHKYDQITQAEYYQLYAFFNNADETSMKVTLDRPEQEAYRKRHQAHQQRLAERKAQLATVGHADSKRRAELNKQLDELQKTAPAPPTLEVRVVSRRAQNPRPTHILRRGEFREPLGAVGARTLSTLPPMAARAGDETPDRLDLAKWLVSTDNPLTPRVAVNHIWKQLFGQGLVRTVNDFGVRGEPPTHPQLMDYLAAELIDDDWSVKQLIRQIVLSATYRQSSRHRPFLNAIDPTNRLLYRQNRFRVEAEAVRDIALASSGILQHRVGGPSVFPPIPSSVTDLTYNSSFKWNTDEGANRYRRGMYTFFKRTAPHPNLITFDCPDSNVTNVDRERSNTPIGALVTLNNPVYFEAAQAMASELLSRQRSDLARITLAFRRCAVRPPTAVEVAELRSLLDQYVELYAGDKDAATLACGDRFSIANDVAEQAAWTALARVLLNMDEFITRE